MLLSGLSRGKPPGLPRERGAPSPAASQRGERQVPGLGPQPDEAGAEPEVQWSRAMWDQDPPVGIQGALPSGWGVLKIAIFLNPVSVFLASDIEQGLHLGPERIHSDLNFLKPQIKH